jgi:primosomal protein N' (replication factor Y)
VRVASITGGRTAVGHFTEAVQQRLAAQGTVLRVAGPAPLVLRAAGTGRSAGTSGPREYGEDVRTLLFVPYAQAAGVTAALRAVKAAAAAKRSDDPVQLRLDGVDVL